MSLSSWRTSSLCCRVGAPACARAGPSFRRPPRLLLLLLLARLLAPPEPLLEQLLLEVRRRAVEDVHRLDAVVDHAKRAVEEAEQMRRRLARLGHELLAVVLTHRDEELVQRHGRVDGHLAPKVRLDLHLPDRARRLVRDERSEALDTHFCCCCCGCCCCCSSVECESRCRGGCGGSKI